MVFAQIAKLATIWLMETALHSAEIWLQLKKNSVTAWTKIVWVASMFASLNACFAFKGNAYIATKYTDGIWIRLQAFVNLNAAILSSIILKNAMITRMSLIFA